ncbi:RNA-directed DNA polymerase, eukaryota [Artemisia annua]|uniref:RNA-directed DNA polymerase, eukaryota n=1 Tax=Artemisia annua TaxID=35608 RepID=A0A2U1PC54_ARTAN|nr:RNA-directed DNA polymerase, eukaryota [Artemisia annua]
MPLRYELVGRVVDVRSLVAMDKALGDSGLVGVEIIYIGGLSFLLKFVNSEEAKEFLSRVEVWSKWFSVLEVWEGQSLPFERIAWLKILGVPLNLAMNAVFDNIAGMFGKVVHASHISLDEGNISFVRVGVLVGEGEVVSDSVNLSWRDKSFKVWVIEDPRDWDPECIGVVKGGVENVDVSEMEQEEQWVPENRKEKEVEDGNVEDERSEDILEEGELREEAVFNYCGAQNINGDSQQSHACMDTSSKHIEVEGKNTYYFASVGQGVSSKNKSGPFRLKHKPIKSLSDERVRPKKRSRKELDDPFDLNKLLGIVNSPSTQEESFDSGDNRVDRASNSEDIDLNVRVNDDSGGSGFVEGTNHVVDQVDEGDVGEDNFVAKEVEATVDVGEVVGVLLAEHVEMVKEALVSEGIGGLVKGPWVGKIRKVEGINFVALQESKLSSVCVADLRPFWGGSRFAMDFVGSTGSAGGVVSMWDPLVFEAVESIKDPNFLLVRGKLKGSGELLNVINVYAPQSSSAKALLWSKIEVEVSRHRGMWMVVGDFNVVRFPEERKNSVFKAGCARVFNEFIHNSGFKEFSMKGRQFTCIRDNGRKLSKLDRMLVCSNLFDKWPEACLRVISGPHSDHCPLILILKSVDFGPRPFRIFNSWFSKPGFEDAVREAVDSFSGVGCPDKVLTHKFAHIRDRMKRWRDDMIRKEGEEEVAAFAELEELESALESRDLEEEEEWTMGECKKVLKSVGIRKCLDLKQRSRSRWAVDGDENSKFFHGLVNNRIASNLIPGLNLNGNWVEQPNLIKREILKFFRNSMVEGVPIRSMFKGSVGDGADIAFWIDPWVADLPLKELAPSLFRLEKYKKCKVKDRLIVSGGCTSVKWKWKHRPAEPVEMAQLVLLDRLVVESSIVLSSRSDRWLWSGNADGMFSVAEVKKFLLSGVDASNNFVMDWCKWVPIKCNVFAWRAALGGIPTSVSLLKRHVLVADIGCQICGHGDESIEHLFTSCLVASVLWQGISQWCKVPNIYAFSFGDLLELHNFVGLKGIAKEVFHGIIMIGCWSLWKARNELRFSNKTGSSTL